MTTSAYGAVPSLTASQIVGMGVAQSAYTINKSKMNLPGITFKITQANGGTIITVTEEARRSENSITLHGYGEREELYVIPDGVEDFDRELGKIITMHRMKQQHE